MRNAAQKALITVAAPDNAGPHLLGSRDYHALAGHKWLLRASGAQQSGARQRLLRGDVHRLSHAFDRRLESERWFGDAQGAKEILKSLT